MQPRDKAAILAVNTIEFTFSSQRREMLHQHGRREVTCKPAIDRDNWQFQPNLKFLKNRLLPTEFYCMVIFRGDCDDRWDFEQSLKTKRLKINFWL